LLLEFLLGRQVRQPQHAPRVPGCNDADARTTRQPDSPISIGRIITRTRCALGSALLGPTAGTGVAEFVEQRLPAGRRTDRLAL